jgi:hypothetical protein
MIEPICSTADLRQGHRLGGWRSRGLMAIAPMAVIFGIAITTVFKQPEG